MGSRAPTVNRSLGVLPNQTTLPPMAARLRVRDIRKSFGATRALDGVSLCAQPGEIHAILGENGAGKSTLMNILAGGLPPDDGSLELDGSPFQPRSPADARDLGVAMVNQELAICPHLTVLDNVMLGREQARFGWLDRPVMRDRALAALTPLAGDLASSWLEKPAGQLPVAAQQLVEIARALVGRTGCADQGGCRLLILDEPTSSLGKEDVDRLFDVIRRLRDEGVTILYISHFLEEVRRVADRFTVLRDGVTVGEGTVTDVPTSEIVRMMAGRRIDQLFVRSAREPGEVLLELDGLEGAALPRRASLALRRGEVLGIAGLVGAGRTELLRSVFGLDAVRSGKVRLGAFLGPASPARRLSQGMGMLSEDRKGEGLASGLSVTDNLTLSRLPSRHGLVLPGDQKNLSSAWIEKLSIKCGDPSQSVSHLSGGNQQKVALARLLHHDVDVLLLDEPTRGIDVGSKAQIYERIDALALAGKAVLMVSSYLPELLGVCDRVCVMHRGVLGPSHHVAECTEHGLLEEAVGAGA